MLNVLLIVPAYNEQDSILNVCNMIKKNGKYDYIVINDGSTANTKNICIKNNLN